MHRGQMHLPAVFAFLARIAAFGILCNMVVAVILRGAGAWSVDRALSPRGA